MNSRPAALALTALLLAAQAPTALAQAQPLPDDRGAPGLWQAWKRAHNTARVLYITAHPDDEDAGTLAWLARGLGVQVTLLSLTHGEGGANVLTADYFDALARLRQLELQRAAAHYGVQLKIGSAPDFGYSKSVTETWRHWNQSALTAEVAALAQQLRPHVIIAKFHGSARDGHGQHTASAEIAKAAFYATQAMPWKVAKLYTGNWNEKDPWTLRADAALYDPVLGRTYQEIGLEGYRWHRSQGMDRPSPFQARSVRYYKREAGPGPAREAHFFEGLNVQPPAALTEALAHVHLHLENPAASVPALEAALAAHPESPQLAEVLARAKGEWRPTETPEAPGAPLSVRFTADAAIIPAAKQTYEATIALRSLRDTPIEGTLRIEGVAATPATLPFRLERNGEEALLRFTLRPNTNTTNASNTATAIATADGQTFQQELRPITAPGLPTAYLRKPAQLRLAPIDVRVAPGLRVGYITGAGDQVPEVLAQLGVPYELLTPEALATADLSRFTTILTGIRAYAARDDLRKHNARLLQFAQNGGTVIIQYNTQEYDHNFGPYPYQMTARAEEISEEDAPVRILQPNHPVFQTPNRITPADFDGWLEQRGSKFWTTWDARYQPLLETNDAGQAPQRGGWLEARTGRGLYIYCAYAWYRQLPAAVPGATRLFANLISRRP